MTDSAGIVEQDSTTGQITQEWRLFAEVWAEIRPLSAREFLAAQQIQSSVSGIIVIRWRNDLNAAMRIVHGTTMYNIAGLIADPDSGREWLSIPVSQGVNAG